MQEGYHVMLDEMLGQLIFGGGMRGRPGRSDSDEEDSDEDRRPGPGRGSAAGGAAQPDADSFRPLLAQLKERAVSIPAKVATLHGILASLRAARHSPTGFVSAGGVPILCDLVTRDWPPGGDLVASPAVVDAVVALAPPAAAAGGGASRRGGNGGASGAAARAEVPRSCLPHHSMRRVAAACLAEAARWPAAVSAMHEAQFFSKLPPIFSDLAARYRFGQSYRKMYGRGRRTDQAQYILERLTHACADAASASNTARRACSGLVLDALLRSYPRLDIRRAKITARLRLRPRPADDLHPTGPGAERPTMAWDSSDPGSDPDVAVFPPGDGTDNDDDGVEEGEEEEGEEGAGGSEGQSVRGAGLGEWDYCGGSRLGRRWRRAVNVGVGAEVPQLEAADSAAPRGSGGGGGRRAAASFMAGLGPGGGPPGPHDPMPIAFMRLVSALWYDLPDSAQKRHLEAGVLASLSAFPVALEFRPLQNMLVHHMRMAFNGMAVRQFGEVRAADAALRERASALRLRGNEAFRAGNFEAALALYTDAVALDWDEPTHRNNRCFALTKLGRLSEARAEGMHSIACDPRNPRSWSRLAAVFEGLKSCQAAQLCYRQAVTLTSPKKDEELETRLRDLESQLGGSPPWRFDTVPARTFFDRDGRWRNWIARFLPKAQVRALEMMEQLSPLAGMGMRVGMDSDAAMLSNSPHLTAAMASESYQVSTALRPLWEMACAIEEAGQTPFDPALRLNLSWSDMGLRDRHTGIAFYTLSCMDGANSMQRSPARLSLGKPRFPELRNVLCAAIARPLAGKPGRPSSVFLAHRAVPYFEKLQSVFGPMGVELLCESQHEAAQSAANYNTDPAGFNHREHYRDEMDDSNGPGAGGAVPFSNDVASDDDATAEYHSMLAGAAAAAARGDRGGLASTGRRPATGAGGAGGGSGGGGGGGESGQGGAVVVVPSEAEVRAATLELLAVSDLETTTVKHLMAALRERFQADVTGMKALVRGLAVRYAQERDSAKDGGKAGSRCQSGA